MKARRAGYSHSIGDLNRLTSIVMVVLMQQKETQIIDDTCYSQERYLIFVKDASIVSEGDKSPGTQKSYTLVAMLERKGIFVVIKTRTTSIE